MYINAFDYDGVISLGITPSKNDVIITGRCIDEAEEVNKKLKDRGIYNAVYFNPTSLMQRGNHTVGSRENSGNHKANILTLLKRNGILVMIFFEDDEIQSEIIKSLCPKVEVVIIKSDLVEK